MLAPIHDNPALRDKLRVFRDRSHAGDMLAEWLSSQPLFNACVIAIPAGGVPVAIPLAKRLHLPFDIGVVSKITLPWNTEAGYGAVAFDGTVILNEELIAHVGLTRDDVAKGISATREKVGRRVQTLRRSSGTPEVAGRTAIVVDDGLASGFTMRAACDALRAAGARQVIVAVPTAHIGAAERVAVHADEIFCVNLRHETPYAVADAYRDWHDVTEDELREVLQNELKTPASTW